MDILDFNSPRRRAGAVFLLTLALFLLRYGALGPRYYPQLDDYIQYHNYPTSESFSALARSVGLLASRPLAGAADYYLWGRMFARLFLGVMLLSALYTLYLLLLTRLLRRYFRVGPLFWVVSAFLPLGMEGLYWVSASSRVVPSLLFGALAALCYAAWLDSGKRRFLALYFPLMLLPFGFYEQGAVLSMTLVLGIALLELPERGRRVLPALWSLASMAVYFIYVKAMAGSGVYGSRTEIMNPLVPYYWKVFLPEVLTQLRKVGLWGSLSLLGKGAWRGLRMLPGHWLWCVLVLLCCAALSFLLAHRPAQEGRRVSGSSAPPLLTLLTGFLLALAPLSLYFLLANPYVTFRGMALSLPGVGLMLDALSQMLLRGGQWRGRCAVLSGVLLLLFALSARSELQDYRDTWVMDQRVGQAVLEAVGEEARSMRIGVFGLEESLLPEQNCHYHGHISGCTESPWAFAGLLTALGGEEHPSVTALHSTPMYRAWNAAVTRPECFDALYRWDGQGLRPVTLRQTDALAWEVLEADGTPLGRVWEEPGETGYYEQYK